MKILVITNLYPPSGGGEYETRCRATVDALRARDHEVEIITSDVNLQEVIGEEQGIVRRLKLLDKTDGLQSLKEANACDLHNKTIVREEAQRFEPEIVYVWNMSGFSRSLLMFIQKLGLAMTYDVCDSWLIDLLEKDALLAWWHRSGRVNKVERKRGRIRHRIFKPEWVNRLTPAKAFNRCSSHSLYFCSDHLRKMMIERGYEVQKAQIIQKPIEVDAYLKKTNFGKSRKLLWVGHFNESDAPMTALESFQLLQNKEGFENATLHLYGYESNGHMEILKRLARRLKITDRVFIQELSMLEENMLYYEHDALLFTRASEDPFPMIPLKAMASSLPVIAASDGAAAELVKDDFNGYTFKVNEPIDLCSKICKLFGLKDYGECLSHNGLAFVKRNLNNNEIILQIEDCLHQAVVQNVE